MMTRVGGATDSLRTWSGEVVAYAREASDLGSFARVVRVRLSESKIGWLVCRHPIVVDVNLRSLGRHVRLRSHTTDISVLGELIVSGGYDPVLPHLAGPVHTVIDLGANIGLVARWCAHRWPDLTISCVEPEAGNVEVLRHNVELVPGATVYSACVGAYERRVRLSTTMGEHGFAMYNPVAGSEGDVDVITIDQVFAGSGLGDAQIDLLKCDIEGAEVELLTDCRSWISRVTVAVVECHNGFDGPQLQQMLRDNGTEFDLVERLPNPDYGCEVVVLRRRT